MVWGGVCGQQRTELIVIDGNLTAHRYINQVLRPVMLPFLQQQPRPLFQQDNARPHTARVVQHLLDANVIVLPWDYLGQRIRCHPNPPLARGHLVQALIQEWRSIPDAVIRRLTNCPTSGPCLHTCTWWTYTLLKRVLCGQIYSPSL